MIIESLTEQWKNGELEWDREYYVDLENNGIVKQLYLDKDGCFVDGIIDYSLKNKPYMEVLAPVPSYEEWQELKEFADYSLHNRNELTRQINFWMDKHTQIEKENQQLKELLKECKANLIHKKQLLEKLDKLEKPTKELLAKIDNAIREKRNE